MRKTLTALALGASLIVTGCGGTSDKPNAAACEKVMRADLDRGIADPSASRDSRPAECRGVSDEKLQEIVGRVMSDKLEGK